MNFIINKIKNAKRKLLLSPFPGHYSSPIADTVDIKEREQEIFTINSNSIRGIDLNEKLQLLLLKKFERFYGEVPFKDKKNHHRYYYDNGYYLHSDAIFLYAMLRNFKPRRIIEVGSGFSSAAMLDSADSLGLKNVRFTFIDPDPERLKSLLRK
ncbi:MAG: class I SAM-dependent methyltransferase, partial [Bacteroidota bacterium]